MSPPRPFGPSSSHWALAGRRLLATAHPTPLTLPSSLSPALPFLHRPLLTVLTPGCVLTPHLIAPHLLLAVDGPVPRRPSATPTLRRGTLALAVSLPPAELVVGPPAPPPPRPLSPLPRPLLFLPRPPPPLARPPAPHLLRLCGRPRLVAALPSCVAFPLRSSGHSLPHPTSSPSYPSPLPLSSALFACLSASLLHLCATAHQMCSPLLRIALCSALSLAALSSPSFGVGLFVPPLPRSSPLPRLCLALSLLLLRLRPGLWHRCHPQRHSTSHLICLTLTGPWALGREIFHISLPPP